MSSWEESVDELSRENDQPSAQSALSAQHERDTLKASEPRTVRARSSDYGTTALDNEATNASHQSNELEYPEGGREAWLVVFGAWCCLIGGLALLNSIGPLQSYIARHQLSEFPERYVTWL